VASTPCPKSIAAVAIGGHIALIGVLTGRAGEIATAQLMAKQARLQGLIVGSRRHQMDFVRAIDAAHIRPSLIAASTSTRSLMPFDMKRAGSISEKSVWSFSALMKSVAPAECDNGWGFYSLRQPKGLFRS
jgi:D-arabinose 1-dehydrogenase-like Zn-dependent alcohol dehydrogenase